MPVAIILLLQAAATIPLKPGSQATLDLSTSRETQGCGEPVGDEIVVCGSPIPEEKYRLRPLPPSVYEEKERKAETRLFGNVNGAIAVESETIGAGFTSKRVMVKVKVPF